MKSTDTLFIGLLACLALAAGCDARQAPERTEGYIEARDSTRIFYTAAGAGDDVLIAPVRLYLEPHLLDGLAVNRRVIFYDPRNRGRSDAASLDNVSLDHQVNDLEDLRAALGIEKMALLGFSGPAMEITVYAMRHPERVSRMVMMAPVPPAASIMQQAGDAREDMVDEAALDALISQADAGEFDAAPEDYCRRINALLDPSNLANPDFVSEVPDVCIYENEWPGNLWPYFGALLPSFGDYDWREDLHELDVPRLVIHGREDGIPLAGAEAWVRGYDNARLIVLSPAGHFVFIEQKKKVIESINTFLSGEWPPAAITISN